MSRGNRCMVVAEGCCNHMGDLDTAFKMTEIAKLSGADFIKWQKRNAELSIKEEILKGPHPNVRHAFGDTYLEHRRNLEFTVEEHEKLKKHADKIDIGYAVSVWDLESAKEMIHLSDTFIKVPSAANYDFDLINYLLENYQGQVHISLGMLSRIQKEALFTKFNNYNNKIVYYHTTTSYPCPFEHLFLKEIEYLASRFDTVGFSGHHKGIAVDIEAYTYGARWIERHFTLDRTLPGTDQAASLEPGGLGKLARDLRAAHTCNHIKPFVTEEEKQAAKKLRTPNSEKYLQG